MSNDLHTARDYRNRTAGWAAHILEQKKTGRLVRPSARYTGPAARPAGDVPGAADVLDRNL